jgi:hypothetical protein
MRTWFAEHCPALDIEIETEAFKNRCLSKGTEYKDWIAGWKTQMGNAVKWQTESARKVIVMPVPAPYVEKPLGNGVMHGRAEDLPKVRRAN